MLSQRITLKVGGEWVTKAAYSTAYRILNNNLRWKFIYLHNVKRFRDPLQSQLAF